MSEENAENDAEHAKRYGDVCLLISVKSHEYRLQRMRVRDKGKSLRFKLVMKIIQLNSVGAYENVCV